MQEQNLNSQPPLILVVNDDGVDAPGIRRLAALASEFGEVVVAAPSAPQSGQSSALTVFGPLFVTKCASYGPGITVFSINGTPVDCVKLGMHAVTGKRRPSLIVSGINHGSNAAINNIYSGTMGAVMEGCVVGVPSVGFSILSHEWGASLDACDDAIRLIISTLLAKGLPEGVCLNVNFPLVEKLEGLKVVRAARGYWSEEYAEYRSPYNTPFYWLTGTFHNLEPDNPDTDEYWLKRGCATIVPIRPDQSAHDMIAPTKEVLQL